MRLSLSDIARFTGAEVIGSSELLDVVACGITWDSREVEAGYVYVALPGNRVDGHTFVQDAFLSGASAALIMQDVSDEVKACAADHHALLLRVSSTFDACRSLARGYRGLLSARIVGITGSSGKTTTKNLVRDVLSSTFKTVATKANQNNELGVPRTILNADPDTEMIVVEMGMRGSGQIASLCNIVKPDWGLITNAGESHIELLGSRDAIACAKAELIDGLAGSSKYAFLNAANDKTDFIWEQISSRHSDIALVSFDGSGAAPCDTYANRCARVQVWARDIVLDGEGRPSFELCAQGFSSSDSQAPASDRSDECVCEDTPGGASEIICAPCHLSLRGFCNVSNACSAAAVGLMAGIPLTEIVRALESSQPEQGRQEISVTSDGVTVINDAYNANPDSMRASLQLLDAMDVQGARYAVLGDMGELGSFAKDSHISIGEYIAHITIDRLVCVGELAHYIASSAHEHGLSNDAIVQVATCDEALDVLRAMLQSGDVVLIKASHFMGLDRIAKELLE